MPNVAKPRLPALTPPPRANPTTTSTTSTTSTTVSVPAIPEGGFGPGDRDDAIRTAEQLLDQQRYDPGPVDGVFDQDTAYALTAFQKVQGMDRSGRLTRDVAQRLAGATAPPLLVPGGGATRVEIDLPRQVLFLVHADQLVKVLPVSSGSGKRYCDDGRCGVAVTPPGAYHVAYRVRGWQTSHLGRLYNPVYFDARRGLAIHGSTSVPPEPASHGCVRIPMSAAEWFPSEVPDGTPVFVLDASSPGPP